MIRSVHYDDETLQALLSSSGNETSISDEVMAHVESCEDCQRQLESLAQEDVTLGAVGEMLRDDSVDDVTAMERDPLVGDPKSAALSFLDDSNHRESLGRFGRYEVMEILGRGGMGIVMRGFDPALNRQSAIKVLAPEYSGSAAARRRFSREAKSAAAVVHPHVVPIQTVEEHKGLPYLVMPVVEGRSLESRVRESGPLEIIEVVRIAAQVAEGLAAAHAQGLVHRDIKPGNVLLENGVERVQITDFGLARAADDASMTRSGIIAGTPQYMSPEQAHGDPIDHRSDLFSLGGLMYFMCTGHSPFRAETTMGVLKRIVDDEPRPLLEINADVPPWLVQIVDRLLAKKAADRFQSADEVSQRLHQWLAHLQAPDTTRRPTYHGPEVALASTSDGAQKNRWWRFPLALAAIPLLALFAILIWLETGRGKLRIETNSDAPVTVSILKGTKTVDVLTLSAPGETIRLYAGDYQVKLDEQVDDMTIENGQVTLSRGGEWLAKVRLVAGGNDRGDQAHPPQEALAQLAQEFFAAVQNDRFELAKSLLSENVESRLQRQLDQKDNPFTSLVNIDFSISEVVIQGDQALASFKPVKMEQQGALTTLVPGMILKRERGKWGVFAIDFISPDNAIRELARWKGEGAAAPKASEIARSVPPAPGVLSDRENPTTETLGASQAEPIYAGQPLSVWQLRFEAETNPVSRIDAATALVALSDRQSPERQVERLLQLGGQLVVGGWRDDIDRFFGNYGRSGKYRFRPTQWSTDVHPDLYESWDKFLDSVELRFDVMAAKHAKLVGSQIALRLEGPSLAEAAFTVELLKWLVVPFAGKSEFCDAVLQLDVQQDSPLQPHLHLALADFYPKATASAKQQYERQTQAIGKKFTEENFGSAQTDWNLVDKWLSEQLENEVIVPAGVLAGAAHALLDAKPEETLEKWFRLSILHEGEYPYRSNTMSLTRRQGKLWDIWLPEVNRMLDANPKVEARLRQVLATLEVQLRVRKLDDNWPVAELVRKLEEHLLNRTLAESKAEIISNGVNLHNPDGYRRRLLSAATNHDLLAYIILAGGELPQSLLTRELPGNDPELQQLHSAFDAFENGPEKVTSTEFEKFNASLKPLKHLLETQPVATVRILLEGLATKLPEHIHVSLKSRLRMLTERGSGASSPPTIEPLLLLAIFAELPEANARVDEVIGDVFDEDGDDFTDHLEEALESEFATRDIAKKWLLRLRDRTGDKGLITQINKLLPGRDRDQARFIEENPSSLEAVLEAFNSGSREARQQLFDPPIPDLTMPQLQDAFQEAARVYRKAGKMNIASQLSNSLKEGHLVNGLNTPGIGGTSARVDDDGQLAFQQFVPILTLDTGPSSAEAVVLSSIELRWSRNWSSKTYGDIHPPIDGTWILSSAERAGEKIEGDELEQWKKTSPGYRQLIIRGDELVMPFQSTPDEIKDKTAPSDLNTYHLELDYDSGHMMPRLIASKGGEVLLEARFMNNMFTDGDQLTIVYSSEGLSVPTSFKTEGTHHTKLVYARATQAQASEGASAPEALEGDESSALNPENSISISVDVDGQITVEGQAVLLKDLGSHLVALHAKSKVRLSADPQVPYSTVVAIVDAVQKLGFEVLNLRAVASEEATETNRSKPSPSKTK